MSVDTAKQLFGRIVAAVCLLAAAPVFALAGSTNEHNNADLAHQEYATPEQGARLGQILVTAQRRDTREFTTPAFTTVITAKDMENMGARNLFQALRTVSGLDHVALGPMGTSHGGMNSYLPIRGLRGGELILINGVPVNNPTSGSYDLGSIPMSAVERVEVVKGAASALYGSAALTGVINIITKAGYGEELGGELSLEGGTESYTRDSLLLGNDRILAGLSCLHLGGQDHISDSYGKEYSHGSKPLDRYGIFLTANLSDAVRFNYMGSREDAGFIRTPWAGAAVTSSNRRQESDQTIEKHFANLRVSKGAWEINNYYYSDDLTLSYDDGSPGSRSDTYRYGVNPQYETTLGPDSLWTLVSGGDYQNEHADTLRYGKHKRDNASAYTMATYSPVDALSLSLGGRAQWIGQSDADDYTEFCPQFQADYMIAGDVVVYANAGRAFRVPDFLNLYYESSFLVGNPDLKPEAGWTYEVGTKCNMARLSAQVAAFLMMYDDKIEVDYSAGSPLTYYNANEFQSYGVEWDLSLALLDEWTVGLGGYWADPTAETAGGADEQVGAKLQISPRVEFRQGRFHAMATLLAVNDRQRNLEDFSSTDIRLDYDTGRGEVSLAANNVFDEENVTYGDMREGSSSQYEYYDTRRIVSVSYRLKF